MKKILVLLLLICNLFVSAQNNVWYFGTYSSGGTQSSFGLDFTGVTTSSGSPVQRNGESGFGYYESVSVVSDNSGKVLYYTNGMKIFDGSHQKMFGAPNELLGPVDGSNGTAVQGAYSVLKPGSQTEYFLFTGQGVEGAQNGFRVSTIDMSLPGNGTVGDPLGEMLVADSALYHTASELMSAYSSCKSDTVWLLGHSPESYDFIRVLITSNGIQSVDIVPVPTPTADVPPQGFSKSKGRGSLDFNNEGTNIIFTAMGNAGSFLLDFDRHTGDISNPTEIRVPHVTHPPPATMVYNGYGCEFSPDGTRAYFCSILTAHGTSCIWQYDIASGAMNIVPGSEGRDYAEIITGNDGKLYVGKKTIPAEHTIGVMENPNNPFNSVGFDPDGITFPSNLGTQSAVSYAMPQGFYCPLSSCQIDMVLAKCDTDNAFQLTASPSGGVFGGGPYVTNDGMFNPATAGIGIHWVTYDNGCQNPDSLQITVNQCCPDTTLSNIIAPICVNEIVDLTTYEVTSDEGIWSIVNFPSGSSPAVAGLNIPSFVT